MQGTQFHQSVDWWFIGDPENRVLLCRFISVQKSMTSQANEVVLAIDTSVYIECLLVIRRNNHKFCFYRLLMVVLLLLIIR